MDHELRDYVSGGFFMGRPQDAPIRLDVSPEACWSERAPGSPPRVYGLWLDPGERERLLEEERPLPPVPVPKVQRLLLGGLAIGQWPAPTPEILGFQVLGFEGERSWTWLEAGLAQAVADELGLGADARGLLANGEEAQRIAHFLNGDDLGPPVIWRPWLVTAHLPCFSEGGGVEPGPGVGSSSLPNRS